MGRDFQNEYSFISFYTFILLSLVEQLKWSEVSCMGRGLEERSQNLCPGTMGSPQSPSVVRRDRWQAGAEVQGSSVVEEESIHMWQRHGSDTSEPGQCDKLANSCLRKAVIEKQPRAPVGSPNRVRKPFPEFLLMQRGKSIFTVEKAAPSPSDQRTSSGMDYVEITCALIGGNKQIKEHS